MITRVTLCEVSETMKRLVREELEGRASEDMDEEQRVVALASVLQERVDDLRKKRGWV